MSGAPRRFPPPGRGDSLTLVVGGQEWAGWQRVAVTRSMDSIPANFDIQVTEKYPLKNDISFNPGDPCQVKIGGDVVITGYVDRYTAIIGPHEHTVRIAGRSKSEDLVDCSAFMGSKDNRSFQVLGGSALSIAQQLAAPYGIAVASIAGPGVQIPQFNIDFGQTPWEIIDRITRYSQLIAYDMPDGGIELAQAGAESMASGFFEGENIEHGAVAYSMDERFSEYEGHFLSALSFDDQAGLAATTAGVATDAGVPRFRPRYILSEQALNSTWVAGLRALWECNRRKARSQAVTLVCDAWRDAAGALWAINHKAPVHLPSLKCVHDDWLIGAVTFLRDETGQHAQITMMAREAFLPQPVGNLTPPLLDDLERNNPTASPNPPYAPGSPRGAAGIPGLPGSPSGPAAR